MNELRHTGLPALPVPAARKCQALADSDLLARFEKDAAGIRSLERNDNVITMFDIIGEDFWSGGGITAKSVSQQLKAIGGAVEVQINSPGGDVFEGFAIYNVLREHPYPVTVKVLGMAASAASVIAMAGDTIQIGVSAFVMIHNCWVLAVGNRHDMQETAQFLEPFDRALRDVYVARTGQPKDKVSSMMDKETYMSGQEAIDLGFADELLPSDQITNDPKAAAHDREVNAVRQMELTLLASGLSRTQARERIQTVKGTKPGAGDNDADEGTPGAAATNEDWTKEGLALLADLKNAQRK